MKEEEEGEVMVVVVVVVVGTRNKRQLKAFSNYFLSYGVSSLLALFTAVDLGRKK